MDAPNREGKAAKRRPCHRFSPFFVSQESRLAAASTMPRGPPFGGAKRNVRNAPELVKRQNEKQRETKYYGDPYTKFVRNIMHW